MAKRIEPQTDDEGRLCIGPQGTSFGRSVYLVTPDDRSFTSHRYVLWFGAYGTTRLMVWANSLETALEKAAEYLAEHFPGHITSDESDEYQALVREVCEEKGIDFPVGFEALEDEARWAITDEAEADLTRTESGFITSYEWGIDLEDPTRAELDAFLYPAGIDWTEERAS